MNEKIPTHQEPVFFERVIRLYPYEITRKYVNRVVFRLLQYVKMYSDPIDTHNVSRVFRINFMQAIL